MILFGYDVFFNGTGNLIHFGDSNIVFCKLCFLHLTYVYKPNNHFIIHFVRIIFSLMESLGVFVL